MDRPKFRRPNEMPKDEKRAPVSARVKETTRVILATAAKEQDLSIGLLIANVLDDYAAWLKYDVKAKR